MFVGNMAIKHVYTSNVFGVHMLIEHKSAVNISVDHACIMQMSTVNALILSEPIACKSVFIINSGARF